MKTQSHTETPEQTQNTVAENAVKLVGEVFVPGASLLMDGKILPGGAHLLAGVLAKAVLGPVGLALVVANSFSKSTTGKSLLKQFSGLKVEAKTQADK